MSVECHPKIITDGLVFYYDQSNTQKSWKGKPTTNLITNPLYVTGNTSTTNIQSSGYGGTATLVTAPSSDLEKISKYWIKYVKTAVDDGRIFFLGDVGTLNIGVDYTYSVYIYTNDSNVSSLAFGSDNTGVSYNSSNLVTWATTDRNQVKRISTIFRSLNGGHCQGFRIANNDPVGSTVYYTGIQCELGSFATPIVNGTRSNTQAILDLTGNNIITANNLTYASDGSFSFNGSSDTITLGYNTAMDPINGITICAWINPISLSGYREIYRKENGSARHLFSFQLDGTILSFGTATTINAYHELDVNISASNYINQWTYVVASYTSGSKIVYRNKEVIGSTSSITGNLIQGSAAHCFGSLGGASEWFNGKIPSVQIYNRALSAAEVSQNFNATRGRYGI